jgi:hypothetical protein
MATFPKPSPGEAFPSSVESIRPPSNGDVSLGVVLEESLSLCASTAAIQGCFGVGESSIEARRCSIFNFILRHRVKHVRQGEGRTGFDNNLFFVLSLLISLQNKPLILVSLPSTPSCLPNHQKPELFDFSFAMNSTLSMVQMRSMLQVTYFVPILSSNIWVLAGEQPDCRV